MTNKEIMRLANEVMQHNQALRTALLRKKKEQLESISKNIILKKDVHLTPEEKKEVMKSAFDKVLIRFAFGERPLLKIDIGRELNRRNQERRRLAQALTKNRLENPEPERRQTDPVPF